MEDADTLCISADPTAGDLLGDIAAANSGSHVCFVTPRFEVA
jgi:hypothetical protein